MERLSHKDLTAILINVMYVKLLLTIPRNMILIAGNAAWLLSVYLTAVMLLLFFLITKIYDFEKPLLDIKSPALRIGTGIAVSLVLLLSMTSVAKIYPETVKIVLLQNTPIEIIIGFIAVVAVLGAFIGIEPLGRISSLFQPIAAVVMVLCFLFLIPHMKIGNLTPVLGNGIKNITVKGLTTLYGFSDIILLYILNTKNENGKGKIKAGYKSIIIMGIIMTVTTAVYCLIFPYSVSSNYVLPLYQMVRLIQIGDFFGRFEAFFEFVWSISILLYYSIYLYTLSYVWQKTFNLPYLKPLATPFIIIVSSIIYNTPSFTQLNKNYTVYATALGVSCVLIPAVVSLIRRGEK